VTLILSQNTITGNST